MDSKLAPSAAPPGEWKQQALELFEFSAEYYAAARESEVGFQFQRAIVLDMLAEERGAVLDIGCAAGSIIAPLRQRGFTVTVDDGYRDFYTTAFPVAQRYGIPATVFLVSDFLDGHMWLWWDALRYLLERTAVERLPEEPGPPAPAATRIARLLQAVPLWPDTQRREFMAQLPERLGVALPARPTPEFEPLRWDEVRAMRSHGIEFGSHTKTHPILPRIESADVLAEELRHPKRRLEEELQEPVNYFCYPNGDWDQRIVDGVAAAGYGLAVTTEWGRNLQWKSPYLLERSPADPSWPLPYFQEVAAFGYPWRKEAS
jgi:peptidoglycan/xylan/chitin deacetylase (PgdA/CDA1 family)